MEPELQLVYECLARTCAPSYTAKWYFIWAGLVAALAVPFVFGASQRLSDFFNLRIIPAPYAPTLKPIAKVINAAIVVCLLMGSSFLIVSGINFRTEIENRPPPVAAAIEGVVTDHDIVVMTSRSSLKGPVYRSNGYASITTDNGAIEFLTDRDKNILRHPLGTEPPVSNGDYVVIHTLDGLVTRLYVAK